MWLIVQYHHSNDSETQYLAQLFPNTNVEFDRQLVQCVTVQKWDHKSSGVKKIAPQGSP